MENRGEGMKHMRANSIRKTLRVTNSAIILAALIPLLISTLYYNISLSQYQRIVQNAYDANSLSTRLESDIYTSLWNVVSGKTSFAEYSHRGLLESIRRRLDELEQHANSEDNSYLIQAALNTLETIESYGNQIGKNIADNRPVGENERILGEIRAVSELLYEVIQQFAAAEMEVAYIQNANIQRSMELMTAFQVLLFCSISLFLFRNYRQLNRRINDPLFRLKTMAARIAKGDLSIRVERAEISELDELTDSLNAMAEQLGNLIRQNTQKQQNLMKAEMKALQAQITPHFMYNTLDTILAMAEDGQNEEVATTTLALSNFFRLSLNKGRDWVSVAEEMSHLESYLSIQKMRYGPILDYQIDVDANMLSQCMLKILLQPLVENAIYHGIKMTRRRGTIIIRGHMEDDNLVFSVEDNGIGMKSEALAQLKANLSHYDVGSPGSGFGLYNVFKRIQLYYEIDCGLHVESSYNQGSRVWLRLPIIRLPLHSEATAVR